MPGYANDAAKKNCRFLIMTSVLSLLAMWLSESAFAQTSPPRPPRSRTVLWMKLEKSILDIDRSLDGVMGVAIVDLTDGRKYLLHANDVFPQASSIKICVLAELYRQAQQGKLKLTDTVHRQRR